MGGRFGTTWDGLSGGGGALVPAGAGLLCPCPHFILLALCTLQGPKPPFALLFHNTSPSLSRVLLHPPALRSSPVARLVVGSPTPDSPAPFYPRPRFVDTAFPREHSVLPRLRSTTISCSPPHPGLGLPLLPPGLTALVCSAAYPTARHEVFPAARRPRGRVLGLRLLERRLR